jgi:hypothetical protein
MKVSNSKLNVAILGATPASDVAYHHDKPEIQRASHKLTIAIREAIQAHTDTHHHDLAKILLALGEVSSDYLSEKSITRAATETKTVGA